MKQKKLLTIILTLIIMNLYHCKDTGLSPGEYIDLLAACAGLGNSMEQACLFHTIVKTLLVYA